MSRWNHNICGPCWRQRHPDRDPAPALANLFGEQTCCYCGTVNTDSIFIWKNPDSPALICGGEHEA